MREVTTRANKLMHPKDADIKSMLCFQGDMVGEIVKITSIDKTTTPNITTYPYRVEWANGIVSMNYPDLETLVHDLESKVKFYHL
jgi:hypothetical protein